MVKRKYRVTERLELPRLSHRNWLFPECEYTLERLENGKVFRMTLGKSLGWQPGDLVELEDLLVEDVRVL